MDSTQSSHLPVRTGQSVCGHWTGPGQASFRSGGASLRLGLGTMLLGAPVGMIDGRDLDMLVPLAIVDRQMSPCVPLLVAPEVSS